LEDVQVLSLLDIREWHVDPSKAQWFPSKGKDMSIKPREREQLVAAVAEAMAFQRAVKKRV
jgi:hypothetical protein